jgi:tetratricopeptide (TPR) repeat protein
VRAQVDKRDQAEHEVLVLLSRLLTAQARFLTTQGMYEQAITAAREATDLARAHQAANLEAAACLQWGTAHMYQGDYEAARSRFEQALAQAQATQTKTPVQLERPTQLRSVEATALRSLGNVRFMQSDFGRATTYYDQALRLLREIGDRRGEGMTLNNLSVTSAQQGDYAGAKAYLEQALRIFREVGERPSEANALGNLGIVYRSLGDYARARAYLGQSLHIKREIGDRQGEATALNNLGIVSRYLGDYARARAYFEQSLHIRREIGDRQGEGACLAEMTLLFHHLDDDQATQEHGQQTLLIAKEVGDRHIQGRTLTLLGHALSKLARRSTARPSSPRSEPATSSVESAHEHLAEASEVYEQALALRRELGQPHLVMESLAGLARVSLAQNDLIQAQAQVEEILTHLESKTLDGTDEPLRIYLTCYHVLRAAQDPRAQEILNTAHNLLQERAAKIGDEELRRSFLENVAVHREIVEGALKASLA